MSRGFQENRADLLRELAQELKQSNRLGAAFFRSAAARMGLTVTDMQVIDLLESTGAMTAGQIADQTGLTTGAITGMLNRLEEGGLVRRERDPNDSRKVIVRLERGKDDMPASDPMFDSIAKAWVDLAAQYDNDQLALLREFLKRSNAIAGQEIIRLRDAPSSREGIFSAPLAGVKSGQLVFPSGTTELTLRADASIAELYEARFEGSLPEVKVNEGVVTIRYPRRLWVLGGEKRVAEVRLNATIPWRIVLQGGASNVNAELEGLDLAGLEVKGGASSCRMELSAPLRAVPIRISGGAIDMTLQRPKGAAARVHLKGWASEFAFDNQTFSAVGNDVRLQSTGFDENSPYYDIEVASSVSKVTIAADL